MIDRLVQHGTGWGTIEISKKKLHGDDVQPGAEANLHHLLHSAESSDRHAIGVAG